MKDQFKLSKLLPMLPDDMQMRVRELVGEDAEYRRKGVITKIEETLDDEYAIIQYVSTRDVDRDKEILDPDGALLDEFRLAPQVLWGHNWVEPPIAKDEWIESDGIGIKAKTIYAFEEYDFAATIYKLRRGGFQNTSSVGFVPMEWVDRDTENWKETVAALKDKWEVKPSYFKDTQRIYTKWLLLEHSDVSVASNVNALTLQKSVTVPAEYRAKLGLPTEPEVEEEPAPTPRTVERVARIVRPVPIVQPIARPVEERRIVQEILARAQGKV